eukprot:symbB.v1.2.005380.t1/scaffold315.1/size251361/9
MLVVSHVLSAVAVSCNFLPLVRDSFPALLGLTVLVSFLLAADFGVIDTICLAATDSGDGEYGEMRAWNCLGCGLASAILGAAIPFASVFSIFYAFLLLQIPILFMFVVFLPNPRPDKPSSEALSLVKCLQSKENVFFLLRVFLYGLCISLPEVFGPIYYMEVLDGTSCLVGAAVLIMCLSEMVVFRFIEQILQKLRADYNMVRGACEVILAVRCLGYCLVPKSVPLIALFVEFLHGITFGAMWFVTVKRADELAPDGARATMQSVASSTYFFFSFDQSSSPTDSSALHIVASPSMMMEDTTTEQLLANCNDLENGKLESSIKNVEGVTLDEVLHHNTLQDAWIVLNGEVLDVTRWIPLHPGGETTITRFLGKDASLEWNMIHAPGTVERHLRFLKKMGKLIETEDVEDSPSRNAGNVIGLLGMVIGMACCKRRRPSTP